MNAGDRGRGSTWLTTYYLATPLFAYLDYLGANIRTVGLAFYPEWRAVYYVLATGVGVANLLRPRWSAPLAILESSVNILLLVLGVLAPYFGLIEALAGGAAANVQITPNFLTNFVLSGGIALTQFYRANAALRR